MALYPSRCQLVGAGRFRSTTWRSRRWAGAPADGLALPPTGWEPADAQRPTPRGRPFDGSGAGAPAGTRTPNLLIRSQMLYPLELPAQLRNRDCATWPRAMQQGVAAGDHDHLASAQRGRPAPDCGDSRSPPRDIAPSPRTAVRGRALCVPGIPMATILGVRGEISPQSACLAPQPAFHRRHATQAQPPRSPLASPPAGRMPAPRGRRREGRPRGPETRPPGGRRAESDRVGWGAGTRTPILRSRAACPAIGRHPSTGSPSQGSAIIASSAAGSTGAGG